MLSSIGRVKVRNEGRNILRASCGRLHGESRRSIAVSRSTRSLGEVPEVVQATMPRRGSELVNLSTKLEKRQSMLLQLSLTEVVEKLRKGETSAEELVKACLAQVKRTEPLNAYITIIPEEKLLKRAREEDEKRERGLEEGEVSLMGVPVAVKDNYCVKDTYTTCGSRMLSGFRAPYDATVTRRLEERGAILLGKTNLDEFAMGSTTTKSAFGATINPWSVAEGAKGEMLTCGGSSGGSAAAVASFSSYASTGTDTGGSVRLPASWSGIVGYKPTYGFSSRFGMVQYASSLDTPALFSRSVSDMKILAPMIRGQDANDSTSIHHLDGRGETFVINSSNSLNESSHSSISSTNSSMSSNKSKKSFTSSLQASFNLQSPPSARFSQILRNERKIRVGIPREYLVKEMNQNMLDTWHLGIQTLLNHHCEIYDISLPHTAQALPAYYVIAPAEAASNLARYDGVRYGFRSTTPSTTVQEMYSRTRSEGFGEEVQRRILIGNFALSRKSYDSYYKKALQIRRLVRDDFIKVFEGRGELDEQRMGLSSSLTSSSTSSTSSISSSSILSSSTSSFGVDVILTPTAPSIAPSIAHLNNLDPIHHYITDIMTIPANLAGIPAVSVPLRMQEGLPVGLQLFAPHFQDDLLLHVASLLELPWLSLGSDRYRPLSLFTNPSNQ